jgi:predicted PurR-regulated permease PerM
MKIERHVVFWIAILVAAVVVIGMLRSVLLPFVFGIVLAYFFHPVADWLEKKGLSRLQASIAVLLTLTAIFVAVAVFLLPLVVAQLQQLAETAPSNFEKLRGVIEGAARERLGDRFPEFEAALANLSQSLSSKWSDLAGWLASAAWSNTRAILSLVSVLLITPLVMFYALRDWDRMVAKVDSWLPRDNAPTIRRLARDIDQAVSAFIRGQGAVCLMLAVYYALSALGLNYGLLIGLATGLLSFIPFVGWALGFIVSLILAIVQFWPDTNPLLIVAGIFLFAQAVDAGYLSPTIIGSKIGLHPVWLIFALMVFSYLFGFLGMLVAVPVAAATGVLVRHALSVYLDSPFYKGEEPEVQASAGRDP